MNASSILALADGNVADTENLREQAGQENAGSSVQLCRQFATLTPENQRIAIELLKALSRLQVDKKTASY